MKLYFDDAAVGSSDAGPTIEVSRTNLGISGSQTNAGRQPLSESRQILILLLVGAGFMGGVAGLLGYLVYAT